MRKDLKQLFRPSLVEASEYVVGGSGECQSKLNQNECPYDLPAELKEELLAQISSVAINRYPAEQPRRLGRAIAEYAGVDPSQVLVTNGSNDFIHTLCLAFVGPGSDVVLPAPMFLVFDGAVRLFGGNVLTVPSADDLSIDVAAVAAVAGREADPPPLTVIACPNNPTGLDLRIDEIEQIVSAAGGFVVVDEAYYEFADRVSALSLLDRYDNVIVMRTLSKAFGLAGARIGYAIARSEVISELLKGRLAFTVDAVAETIGCFMLQHVEVMHRRVDRMLQARQALEAALRAVPTVDVLPSVTNFILFKTPMPAAEIERSLAEEGVLVRNMSAYPRLAGYLRASAGTEAENRAFVAALESTLAKAGVSRRLAEPT